MCRKGIKNRLRQDRFLRHASTQDTPKKLPQSIFWNAQEKTPALCVALATVLARAGDCGTLTSALLKSLACGTWTAQFSVCPARLKIYRDLEKHLVYQKKVFGAVRFPAQNRLGLRTLTHREHRYTGVTIFA